MTRKSDEIERRVNMALMSKQVNEIHELLTNKEDGICKRVEKNEDDIRAIKTIWSTVTVVACGLWAIITHFWSRK